MATTVQIAVTLDANGAVTGVKNLGGAFDDLGNKSNSLGKKATDGFNGIESSERRAHIAGQLFVRLTGTEMPRALENVIAKSKIAGPLLAAAFNAGIVAAVGVAIVGVIGNVVSWAKELGGATAEMARLKEATVAANMAAIVNPQTLLSAREHLTLQIQTVEQMRQQADEWSNSNMLAKAYAHTLSFLGDEEFKQFTESEKRFNDNNRALEELNKNTVALTRSVRTSRLEAQTQIDQAGKRGFALIQQQRIDEDRMARASFDLQSGLSDALTSKLAANKAKEKAATAELYKTITQATVAAAGAAAEAQLKGDAKINESVNNRITAMRFALMQETGLTMTQIEKNIQLRAEEEYREKNILAEGEHQRIEMHRQTMATIVQMESEAAVAALPEWMRAEAQIRADHEKTFRQIDQELKDTVINEAEAQRERSAMDAITNAHLADAHKQLTEQLGSDLQSVFDDMTSGNIGKRILANMEKLFFQIVAQWILSLNVMKSAAGSIFGSIVFGPGSTGAGVFGGGGGAGTSILGSLFGVGAGSSAPSGAAFQPGGIFSDPSAFAGGSGLSSAIAGTGAAPGGGLLTSASNALTSSTMADALAGGSPTSSAAGRSGGISSLFTGGNLASLGGLGLATIGSAFGGKTGQAGGLLMGLLMSGKLAPVLSSMFGTSLGLAGTGALVGGLTGGLIGFGIGQAHGGLLGSLAGAGSGALTGFMVGGPIGAAVGGIIGLLGGIFGGIFGGSKRKKQANALADNTLLPDIAQISTAFDSFQVDSSSAIQQLEQLRSDSQKQLSALQGQGKDVFNLKVSPNIDLAERHIRDTQSERDRRSSLQFGPPQFDTGGVFRVNGGSHGIAILQDGETVIKTGPSRSNKEILAAINAGAKVGSGPVIQMTVVTMDAKSFEGWARSGGAQMIQLALDRHAIEGH